MKITLIKPHLGRGENSPYIDEGRMEPLQLGLLAALCPEEADVALYDDRCEPIPFDLPTDLVALTVETFTARRAYEISAEYKRRGVPVVLGGVHPTLLPEEAALHADALVLGDAETVWGQVLRDARFGRLKPVYQGRTEIPQKNLFPRRELFQGKGYLPVTLSQFGRGCVNACTYCAVSVYFNRTHFFRPVQEVVEEIKRQDRRFVFFVDDNITANPEAAKTLFRALIPLRIEWVSQAGIDMVFDRELMDLMCESGCRGNVIGFESLDPIALQALNKGPNQGTSKDYEKEIGILKSYGLQTWAAFLVGHDGETPQSLYHTLHFAQRHKFTFAAFNIIMPYPNTPWYAQLAAENRLLYDGRWWLHPDYRFNHAAFKPAWMTAEELTRISFDLRRRWNTPFSILQRFLDPSVNMRTLSHMAIFWAYNPLFRREVYRKQNLRLGDFRGAP